MNWYVCTYADGDAPFVTAVCAETEDQAKEKMFKLVDAMLIEASMECISIQCPIVDSKLGPMETWVYLDQVYGPFASMVHPVQQMMNRLVQRGIFRHSGN